jgi:SagB-type dehydrogenase family enzyme
VINASANNSPSQPGAELHQLPQTPFWAPWVYGDEGAPLDDPAECFHEASKLYPSVFDHRVPGAHLLERSIELQVATTRAVKRRTSLPSVELPQPAFPAVTFEEVVNARRSARAFGADSVTLEQLSTLLHAAYGVTGSPDQPAPMFRAVPSGGALYPLEMYAVALNVDGLDCALYHFDPLRRVLERLRVGDAGPELESLTVYPELFTTAAVVFYVTAMFWRTRFKYGLRGYRFALLEAGHLGQNLMLAATALGLAAVPVGGFYDRRVEEFLGVDGVNEAPLYAFSVGRHATQDR